MVLLLFCHVVIPLLALGTCQCDFYTHNFHLRLIFTFCWHIRLSEGPDCRFLGIKKKPTSIRPAIISRTHGAVKGFYRTFVKSGRPPGPVSQKSQRLIFQNISQFLVIAFSLNLIPIQQYNTFPAFCTARTFPQIPRGPRGKPLHGNLLPSQDRPRCRLRRKCKAPRRSHGDSPC